MSPRTPHDYYTCLALCKLNEMKLIAHLMYKIQDFKTKINYQTNNLKYNIV